jgi:hypothetical protein
MTTSAPTSGPDRALWAALRDYFVDHAPPGVVSTRLFGSHSQGTTHRESDIDVGVLLDHVRFPRRIDRSEAQVDLTSGLIGATRCNEVDVVILNDAPPLLARRILKDGVVVGLADEAADHAFLLQTLSRAADLEPWLRRMSAIKLEALRR